MTGRFYAAPTRGGSKREALADDVAFESRVRQRLLHGTQLQSEFLELRLAPPEHRAGIRQGLLRRHPLSPKFLHQRVERSGLGHQRRALSAAQSLDLGVWGVCSGSHARRDGPQLGLEGHRFPRYSRQGCLTLRQSTAELLVPLVNVGSHRVRGPAPEELAHPLNGGSAATLDDAFDRLPDLDPAGLWFPHLPLCPRHEVELTTF